VALEAKRHEASAITLTRTPPPALRTIGSPRAVPDARSAFAFQIVPASANANRSAGIGP
jgi:hypothetical protein